VFPRKEDAHITHRNHPIDFLDSQPVKYVRHQSLEPAVLDACDELGRFEVLVGRVAAPFAEVVNEVPKLITEHAKGNAG